MDTNTGPEIFNARIINAPLEVLYEAFANPMHLQKWWGPQGFTNTFHEFDLKPGGNWKLTMHGPEQGHYENASVFRIVQPQKLISWTRTSKPLFDMEIGFGKISATQSRISFRMIFEHVDECEKIRRFAEPKNEENFDRLERLLSQMEQA